MGLRPLRAVLRAGLPALGDACGVEAAANDLVAVSREVLHATAADEDDRVLLQVVPLAWDVGADLHPIRQPHAGDLAERRVRLLRGLGHHTRADAALLRGSPERGCLGLHLRRLPALADELVDCGHALLLLVVGRFLTQKWLAGKQHTANRLEDRSRPPMEKAQLP